MEYREESYLGSEMFGFGGYFQKGFGTGAEQEVIEDPLVLQDELGELVGKGEDNMDVGDRQEFVLASRDPFIAGSALAFWAMPIAATVERDGAIAAARALVTVPAQSRRATACDGTEDFAVGAVDPAEIILDEALALGANDVGHLEEGPSHYFLSLRERGTASRLVTSSASSGLGIAWRCLCERCR
jgi:hypothetical protein